ncbi:MAG: response regulator transcription factor [Candidatus Omnitrophota bacterium]
MAYKILLVDDEPDIVQIISFRLEKAGYDVDIAVDGAGAMKAYEKGCPDLILLDVMLPDMEGFDVCAKIKAADPQQKIIIYTAKVDGVDAAKARNCGADEFTVKTTDLKFILEAIQNLLSA